jgi:ABC-type Fe3+/spermidine/putrescine transport system ATPase subunit
MQQRVALARGLASGAKLLLLDEPLGALDARLRLELRHKLREIVKRSGLTAIHVTHDRDEAMSVADRILILRAGRIEDYGMPEMIYNQPKGIFTANLIGGANFLEGVPEAGVEMTTVRLSGGITVQTRSHSLTGSEPVIIGVRKERVTLNSNDAENRLDGEIREVRFLGNMREYIMRMSNGDTIASRQFSEGREEQFRVGDRVGVGFDRRDVMVFAYPSKGLRKELEII